MLVLDDLHWADKPSLLLLEFLAQELRQSRLLVIGTYRDTELSRQHPLSETLAELSRTASRCNGCPCTDCTERTSGGFFEMTTDVTPPQTLLEMVHTQTEGNPLFLTEVVRLLVQEGELAPGALAATPGREPAYSRRGTRSDRQTPQSPLGPCNQMLTIAAVIGREFGVAEFGVPCRWLILRSMCWRCWRRQ